MTFWAYMLHCNGGYFYTGHTDDLEHRMAQHAHGQVRGFVRDHWPAKLVWSADFATRYEALSAERQIKGWSRAKKLALIRGDWDRLSGLARSRKKKGQGFDRLSPNGGWVSVDLKPHPHHPTVAISGVQVSVALGEGRSLLIYSVHGEAPFVPPPAAAVRTDALWSTTCFELFIMRDDGHSYLEFNFSPSSQWAAYRFESYRASGKDLPMAPPTIEAVENGVRVSADISKFAPSGARLGLAAIIEEKDGTKSYWALAHPDPEKPDFHHPAGFVLELPA
jgi:predicted GIY-YIG superfamily endonuclease